MMLYYFLPHIYIALCYLGQNSYLSYQCLLNIISLENMLNVFCGTVTAATRINFDLNTEGHKQLH